MICYVYWIEYVETVSFQIFWFLFLDIDLNFFYVFHVSTKRALYFLQFYCEKDVICNKMLMSLYAISVIGAISETFHWLIFPLRVVSFDSGCVTILLNIVHYEFCIVRCCISSYALKYYCSSNWNAADKKQLELSVLWKDNIMSTFSLRLILSHHWDSWGLFLTSI